MPTSPPSDGIIAPTVYAPAGAYTVGAIIPSDGGLVGIAGHDLSQS